MDGRFPGLDRRLRPGYHDRMTRALLAVFGVTVITLGCAKAPAPVAPARPALAPAAQAGTITLRKQIRERAAREVRHWDRDGDGLLTTFEAEAAGVPLQEFIRRDRSDDGGLSATEWCTMDELLETLRRLRELALATAGAPAGPDGRLDAAEWRAAIAFRQTPFVDAPDPAIADQLFRAADHQADGLLDRDEAEDAIGRGFEAGWDPAPRGR